jgi:hypothetical protein
MFVVLVKHYLNKDGEEYFKTTWFPLVKSIISQKEGYHSIEYIQKNDTLFITIQFRDRTSFFAWNVDSKHSDVIQQLDKYRNREYWESTNTDIIDYDPLQLKWDINKVV